ncbi:MAG: DUF1345 domain-containing protein [Chthoniobacterales bacterium]
MAKSVGHISLFQRLGRLDSDHRQFIAIVAAVIACLLYFHHGHSVISHFIMVWDIYAPVYLLMAWVAIFTADPVAAQSKIRLQDSSRLIIFAFVVAAACMSLGAVIFVLQEHHRLQKPVAGTHLFIALFAVVTSWVLVHTVFALHYAHIFYRDRAEKDVEGNGGGLDFPKEKKPDYLDFAYFSFIIGMTCQVSDVQITSRSLRRMALLHGLLSFAFNTVILAVCINILAGIFIS